MKTVFVRAAIAAAAFGLAAPAALADTGENIDTCLAALEAKTAEVDSDATFKFRKARGSRTQELRFRMRHDGGSDTVVCKVKSGEIVDIEWPAEFAQTADADTSLQ